MSLTPKNQYTQEYEMNPELYAEGVAKVLGCQDTVVCGHGASYKP